ncbi:MAG: fibrobacter succinogenes major paralogous domain-containing protein, partial [Bacteroidota bacterium]
WMAENLRVTKYNNGVSLTNVTNDGQWETFSSGAYASYENKTTNDCPYGKIYNWRAVINIPNICPAGWHVPTDAEWNVMMAYLDQSYSPTTEGIQSSIAGGQMKSTGIQYWQTSNTAATNNSGFSGLPGGRKDDASIFVNLNTRGYWWSNPSSPNINNLLNRALFNSNGNVNRVSVQEEVGASVRCVKD